MTSRRLHNLRLVYSDLSDFEHVFVQALIVHNLEVQNRPALVTVFSSKAPEFIAAEPVVIYLSDSRIPDSALILFDSYKKTTNANTKETCFQSWVMRFGTSENN